MPEIPEPLCDCFDLKPLAEEAECHPVAEPKPDDMLVFVKSIDCSGMGHEGVIANVPFTAHGVTATRRGDGLYFVTVTPNAHHWRWVKCRHGFYHIVNYFPHSRETFQVHKGEIKVYKEMDGRAGKPPKKEKAPWHIKFVRRLQALTPGRYFAIITITKDGCDWTVVEAGKVER